MKNDEINVKIEETYQKLRDNTQMNTQWNIKTFREMARKNSCGLLSLLGCFIIHLSLGSFYCFGNLTTYMTSYMKNTTSPDITYGDFIIVQSGKF